MNTKSLLAYAVMVSLLSAAAILLYMTLTPEDKKCERPHPETELLTLRLEYLKSGAELQPFIAKVALRVAEGAPKGSLSPHTQAWVRELKTN